MDIIAKGEGGFYHPASEAELSALVKFAYENRRKLRVRGSSHSVPQAIYTDGYEGQGDPPPLSIEVMLDAYRDVTITPDPDDPTHATVEVCAGCNLGKDPYDPTGTATWERSLNDKLQKAGYALDDLGGITHQTISGFISTGSSGGTLRYSAYDAIVRLRLIDGTGVVHDLRRDDPDPAKRDRFFAAGVSMGLLGVLSKVWLRVGPSFNLFGKQTTASTETIPIDLFGAGKPGKPSLADYLARAPYARLMWWPQKGFRRIQVWEAARVEPMPGFTPNPYLELGRAADLASLAGSLFYTVIGNLDDLSVVPSKLEDWYAHLEGDLEGGPDRNACPSAAPGPAQAFRREDVIAWLGERLASVFEGTFGEGGQGDDLSARELIKAAGQAVEGAALPPLLAKVVTQLIEKVLDDVLDSAVAELLAKVLKLALPYVIADVIGMFVSDGTEPFWDTWMCGLPMDNQMDDQLWPTVFTELWIPIEKAAEAMARLDAFYSAGGDAKLAYEHTGAFSCELYAASKCDFWMSPSYGTDVLRVDVFWFGKNAGSPNDVFYPRFWELLRDLGFRPHWGKNLPESSDAWRAYYRANHPKLDDFLALRAELDPGQIFVTTYWRDHLGIPPLP